MHRRLRLLLAISVGACAGPGPTTTPSPTTAPIATSFAARPTPTAPISPTPSPGTTVGATPSASHQEPDRFPDWLVGAPFAIGATEPGTPVVVGRVGLPERIRLAPDTRVLGMFGDHVLTGVPANDTSLIRVVSFTSGEAIGDPVAVEGYVGYGHPFSGGIVTDELQVISAADGSVRTLVDPGKIPEFEVPTRVVAVSTSGNRIATSICKAGLEDAFGCRRTSIIDIETGALVDTIDAGLFPVAAFTRGWLLTRSFVAVAAIDWSGRTLWTADDLGPNAAVWDLAVLGGDIVATVQGLRRVREALIRIDPRSGAYDVLFTEPEDEDWRLWTSWSTDAYVVLGHDDPPDALISFGCGDCVSSIVDAAVIDLGSGTFEPDAIHINLAP